MCKCVSVRFWTMKYVQDLRERVLRKKRRNLSGGENTIIERNTMVAINEVNDKASILRAMQHVSILGIAF